MAVWLIAGLIGAMIPSDGAAPGDDVTIHLVGTAIHYDFLLPATPRTRAAFGFATDAGVPVDALGARWILIGWGARDFYTATGRYSDMEVGPVWRAVTGDASVLRVEVWGDVDLSGRPELRLGAVQYDRLLAALVASTDRQALNHPGFTATDGFFGAVGRFDLWRTCNVWVGQMLRAAGVRFGVWTPTPQAVRLALRWHG
ncbi:DUF2459 domain-containing protein [Jannaschia donghaensis]|uniref:DUF2459 domain-containing protein n=1 Tax=Jannaschia donghaensis TaxID=420998 RepID=UPI0006D8179E|nr:DUF2459 domain-containing protein [Jannaschia donghaensis]